MPNTLLSSLQTSLSPTITLDSPTLAPAASFTPSSRGSSRSRSLSPPSSPPPIGNVVPPSPSRMFASRPSPVVPSPSLPAPPSFSRPTSPRPARERSEEPPSSPTREGTISASGSTLDLSHIFERDVEFNSTHQLSTQEAVDVAIPPVLDEAIMELSSSDPQEVASIVRDLEAGTSSGWSSPVTPAPSSYHVQAHPYASKSRSPTRGGGGGGGGRSFSPDSASSASGRATSPGSSASFSIGTPGSSPPGSYTPFNQHLTEALRIESEARKKPGFSLGLPATGNLTALPFPSISSASSSASDSVGGPQPSGAALDATQTRLSFFSLADVINEERLAELTGTNWEPAPLSSEVPSRKASAGAVDAPEFRGQQRHHVDHGVV